MITAILIAALILVTCLQASQIAELTRRVNYTSECVEDDAKAFRKARRSIDHNLIALAESVERLKEKA